MLAWNLLTRDEDYAFVRPSLMRRKLRRLELTAGAAPAKTGPKREPTHWGNPRQDLAERQLVEQGEAAYRRLVSDWQASRPKAGAGATPERASLRPSKGKAARQAASS